MKPIQTTTTKRGGKKYTDRRHIRAVISASLHKDIQRIAIDRDCTLENVYEVILGAGVRTIRGEAGTVAPLAN